ncbi:MAG: CRISPR-associated endonuclease Cas1 [Phycisphaerae bacterium]|nr:CRISPR-associated endonuclease Cas1 [Phycisphaerae bacterium]
MKRRDNTLYVTTQGSYLARQRETLLVRVDKETRRQFPIHTLGAVVCFGNVSFSPFALGLCSQNGVAVSFLSEQGRFLGRLEGPVGGNVLLRKAQYWSSESLEASALIARAIVLAKVANARTVLLRAVRDGAHNEEAINRATGRLAETLHGLQSQFDLDAIRGAEGEAAKDYFAVFNDLIVTSDPQMQFKGRSRRPPMDPVNAMMSFLSVLLAHDVRSACETVGLDPQMGFLHRDRPGRASLALDLMEELRPVLVDRLVLSLINRRQVAPTGFRVTESGGVEMDEKTRKALLQAWQKRKADELTHPFVGEKMTFGLLVHVQARLLARHLRGDLDAYPAFFWR